MHVGMYSTEYLLGEEYCTYICMAWDGRYLECIGGIFVQYMLLHVCMYYLLYGAHVLISER